MKQDHFSHKFRLWIQAGWFALTNGYARGFVKGQIFTGNTKVLCVPGLNCYSCPGALGACPIGSLQAVLNNPHYRFSLYLFGFLSMVGVVFGRVVCGFLCPFGLVQDLMYRIPAGRKLKNLPGHRYLKYIRYGILAVFVILMPLLLVDVTGTGQPWFCEWICPGGTLLAGIPLVAMNASLRSVIGLRFGWKVAILIVCLLTSIRWYRPFCKYICPLGAIYGMFNPISTYRIVVDPDKCVKCGSCQRACRMDIRTFETPNSPDCIRCGDCMAACPTGALDSSWNLAKARFTEKHLTVDDAPVKEKETVQSNPEVKRTIALGILMLVCGISSVICGTFLTLYLEFTNRLSLEAMAAVGPQSLILETVKIGAAVLMTVTGFILLRNRNDGFRVSGAAQKLWIAYLIVTVMFVICIVLIPLNPLSLSLMFTGLSNNPGMMVILPMCAILASMLKRRIEGKVKHPKLFAFGFGLLYIIAAVCTVYPVYLAVLSTSIIKR